MPGLVGALGHFIEICERLQRLRRLCILRSSAGFAERIGQKQGLLRFLIAAQHGEAEPPKIASLVDLPMVIGQGAGEDLDRFAQQRFRTLGLAEIVHRRAEAQ